MTKGDSQAIFEVIGSTVLPEEDTIPRLLSPVVRSSDDSSYYYLPDEESGTDPERWPRESREWLDEELDAGDMFRIEPPIPWKHGHVLLQTSMDQPPEFVSVDRHEERLAEFARDALIHASRHCERDEVEQAAAWAWRALRAQPDDPMTGYSVVALERGVLPDEGLEELVADLRRFGFDEVREAIHRHARESKLAMLIARVTTDPAYRQLEALGEEAVSRPVMPYLKKYTDHPGFIIAGRRAWRVAS